MTISDDYAVLFVGANGCSPEREPREKRDLTYGEPGLGLSVLGIDGDRRQELVSPLFEMLRDDNFRRLCSSFVGANGSSPERVMIAEQKWRSDRS